MPNNSYPQYQVIYDEIRTPKEHLGLPNYIADAYLALLFISLVFVIISIPIFFLVKKQSTAFYMCITVLISFFEIAAIGLIYEATKYGLSKVTNNIGWVFVAIFAFIMVIFVNAIFVASWVNKKKLK